MRTVALVLALVFVWAAVAKLRNRSTTTRSFEAFGLPAAAALAVLVPLVELALAAALVVNPVLGATLALPVLAGFTAQLLLARRRGVVTGCGCFGGARPASPTVELTRNAALAAAALTILLVA